MQNIFKTTIITEQGFNEETYEDIKNLVNLCNDNDDTGMKYYLDGEDEDVTSFLFYNQSNLIGYFGTAPSYIGKEVFVWGIAHPHYRTRNFINGFINQVKNECANNNKETLKILNERNASYLADFIVSTGANIKYSTYEMIFNKEYYVKDCTKLSDLLIEKAVIEDLDDIIPIGMEAFETTQEDELSYTKSKLDDPDYSTFICKMNNIPVGMVSVRMKNGEGSIADLAVLKEYRRRGIGQAILSKTISYLIDEGYEKFILSVESENREALSLYENSGFRSAKIIDCYEMSMNREDV